MSDGPRAINVQFADVTAEHLRLRASTVSVHVMADIGDALTVSFPDRAAARAFFAVGLAQLDDLG